MKRILTDWKPRLTTTNWNHGKRNHGWKGFFFCPNTSSILRGRWLLNADREGRIADSSKAWWGKQVWMKTPALPLCRMFSRERDTLLLGPKLIHIRNEDVGPNDLPSPLEESSDAQGDRKTAWGALNLSAPRLKSSLRPTSLLCNLRTPSKRLDRQVDSQAFGSETRGVTFSSLIPIIHLWCIKIVKS